MDENFNCDFVYFHETKVLNIWFWSSQHLLIFLLSLSGGELFDRLVDENHVLTEPEVVHYMKQICEGMKHMHERHLVHLDLKVCLDPIPMLITECIDRESCDTRVKGHPKEFHVIVDHERVPKNSSNVFVRGLYDTGLLTFKDHTGN